MLLVGFVLFFNNWKGLSLLRTHTIKSKATTCDSILQPRTAQSLHPWKSDRFLLLPGRGGPIDRQLSCLELIPAFSSLQPLSSICWILVCIWHCLICIVEMGSWVLIWPNSRKPSPELWRSVRTWGWQGDQGRGTVCFRTDSGQSSWYQSPSYKKQRVGLLYAFLGELICFFQCVAVF